MKKISVLILLVVFFMIVSGNLFAGDKNEGPLFFSFAPEILISDNGYTAETEIAGVAITGDVKNWGIVLNMGVAYNEENIDPAVRLAWRYKPFFVMTQKVKYKTALITTPFRTSYYVRRDNQTGFNFNLAYFAPWIEVGGILNQSKIDGEYENTLKGTSAIGYTFRVDWFIINNSVGTILDFNDGAELFTPYASFSTGIVW